MTEGLETKKYRTWNLRDVLQSLFSKSSIPLRTEDHPSEPQKQINALKKTTNELDTFILELQVLNNTVKNYLEKASKTENITEKYNYTFNAYQTTHKIFSNYINIK